MLRTLCVRIVYAFFEPAQIRASSDLLHKGTKKEVPHLMEYFFLLVYGVYCFYMQQLLNVYRPPGNQLSNQLEASAFLALVKYSLKSVMACPKRCNSSPNIL